MDLKKVLDQTVRELKREVNKKVLKVPEIEQKVLDATSNEPWGPHGTHMADIAQATRNYNEYQMIMTILWKRINDTGRNWRHVYKALTILEYLVAHGSERVIDELKEHAYQISTLADFQYIDSSGKDQGQNVRKKSQALVALVNDKEKIREVRQKAVSNRDKYRGVSSTGGIYKPSSYHSTSGSYGGDRYDDDSYGGASRYGSRDDDRYRDRDFDRYRDDDRYGRDGDRYGRDGDRYGRDGDRYSRDEYNREYEQDDSYHSSRRGDDRQSEKYSSFERERDRSYDDDDRHSSRSGGRGDDYEMDDRRSDRKAAGSRMPAPPSYEEALGSSDYGYGSAEEQRDGGGLAAAVARASKSNSAQATNGESTNVAKALPANVQSVGFDEFDPRASTAPVPAAPTVAAPANFPTEDLFGPVDTVNGTKALPAPPAISNTTSNASDYFGDSSTAAFTPATVIPSNSSFQSLDADVFGDSPFKAEGPVFSANATASNPPPPSYATNLAPAISGTELASRASSDSNGFNAFAVASANQTATVSFAPAPANQTANASYGGLEAFGNDTFTVFGGATNGLGTTSVSSTPPLPLSMPEAPQMNLMQPAAGWTSPQQSNPSGNLLQPAAMSAPQPVIPAANQVPKPSTNSYTKPQQEKKFETKSTVWADTLSKGLIDLNIAGPKTNPLADIGIDFDLLRTERIKEERASTAKTSTTNMGKAMGSGSGLGLAGAGAIVPPAAPVMMNSVGMGMGPGMGMNSMGMGSGMGMAPAMPMGVNPGMAMRPGMGMGPVPGMGMGMNPMMGMGMGMGTGGYPNSQQQYSGYR